MKRILWCGGSHLANARPQIEAAHKGVLSIYKPDYYVTAGPRNRDWSGGGGRYTVHGSVVSRNAHEPDREIDLSGYDALVFIGQFIQPFKAFIDGMQHSSAVVDNILKDLPMQGYFHDPSRNLTHRWYNEPLELFPPFVKGSTFIVPDPAPAGQRYASVPAEIKRKYHDRIEEFCAETGCVHIPTPQELCTADGTTKEEFVLPGDPLHMKDSYWQVLFETKLLPAMRAAL